MPLNLAARRSDTDKGTSKPCAGLNEPWGQIGAGPHTKGIVEASPSLERSGECGRLELENWNEDRK